MHLILMMKKEVTDKENRFRHYSGKGVCNIKQYSGQTAIILSVESSS